jgi:hypothetical protein
LSSAVRRRRAVFFAREAGRQKCTLPPMRSMLLEALIDCDA